ncbi:EF-hand domain-containing protein [Haloferula sargassicola]|uniref:EF-hand domain-containing protein n=1 Tax=Haloferula sargassicola TaxID=490096 RepID=A0ABP9ULU0_9BACT
MKHLLPLLLLAPGCAHFGAHTEEAHNRKVMALQEKFDRFDYNANGELTRGEIEQGILESDVKGVTPEELDLLMKHYDVNDDGAISRWESQRAIDTPLPEELQDHHEH